MGAVQRSAVHSTAKNAQHSAVKNVHHIQYSATWNVQFGAPPEEAKVHGINSHFRIAIRMKWISII